MLKVIHGENQVASRKKLVEFIEQAKQQNKELVKLNAEKLDRAKLETALLSESLFGQEKLLIVEGLYSLPKSNKKDEFIQLISSALIDIILWDKKSLTKSDLKKLPAKLENFEFKITAKMWAFLDSLSPNPKAKISILKLFQESAANDSSEFVFLMIARQIRFLIQVKEKQLPKVAPFTLSKLNKQAKEFSLEKLLNLHQQLYLIDQKQKQSTGLLNLEGELDLFIFNM